VPESFQFDEQIEEQLNEAPKPVPVTSVEAAVESSAEAAPIEMPAPEKEAPPIETVRPPAAAASVESGPRPTGEAQVSSLAAEEKMQVETSPVEPSTGKRVEVLSREELLETGEKIVVNGETLRHAFETHMIGEQGLRRLIAEHLRGGNLYETLRREIVEHQMDFERDPVMRGRAPTAALPVTAHTKTLDKLLENADVSLPANEQSSPPPSPAASSSLGLYDDDHAWKQPGNFRLADIVLAAVIGSLILLIIIVLLIRH
jgi:hypothetical protein